MPTRDEAKRDPSYEIIDGVRRVKAAEVAGRRSIAAQVYRDRSSIEVLEVSLSQLYSPTKLAIDVSSSPQAMARWKRVLDATLAGEILDPIIVRPGSRGPRILEVFFL